MPAISAPDLAIIRKPLYRIKDLTVDLVPLNPIGTALIDSLVGLEYPLADIPIKSTGGGWGTLGTGGTHDSFRRGQLIRVTRSGEFVANMVWRRAYNGTTLLRTLGIDRGDTGIAYEQAEVLQEDDVVTCYDVFVPSTVNSRIASSIYYKRWDLAFTSFEDNATPQANIGTHRSGTIDSITGVLTLEFEMDATSTSWLAGTLAVTWELPVSGAAFAAGYVATDNPVQIEFEPGAHIVTAAVTDTERPGATDRNFRYVFAHGDDGVTEYRPFSETYKITAISNDIRNRSGRSLTFRAIGSGLSTALYTGAPVLMTWTDQYSSDRGATWTSPSAGTTVNSFFGHVRKFDPIYTDAQGVQTVDFTVLSPLIYGESLPFISQYLIEAATPAQWWEVTPACSHAGFIPFFAADFTARYINEMNSYYPGDGDLYFKKRWDIDADNLADAIRLAARPFLGNIGNTSDGGLYLMRDSRLETDAVRNANPSKMTLTDVDILTPLQYIRDEVMSARETEGGAFIYTGEGTQAALTGKLYRKGMGAPMQGVEVVQMPGFIALTTAEAAAKVGHQHQLMNAPTKQIAFNVPGGRDVFDPALMEWITFDVASYDPMAYNLFSDRALVESVTTNWTYENESWVKRLSVIANPETYGQIATNRTAPTWDGQGITPVQAWCYEWDATAARGDWEDSLAGSANWAVTTGWSGSNQNSDLGAGAFARKRINIGITFTSTVVTRISFTYSLTKGTVSDTSQTCISISDSANISDTRLQSESYASTANTASSTYTWTGSRAMSLIQLWLSASFNSYSGACTITNIVVEGTGANPFGANNC